MPAWLYVDGHIGWALFIGLVYSGLCVLATDYAWRCVTMRGTRLFATAGMFWIAGLIVLLALALLV
jgi:hypothetical protein